MLTMKTSVFDDKAYYEVESIIINSQGHYEKLKLKNQDIWLIPPQNDNAQLAIEQANNQWYSKHCRQDHIKIPKVIFEYQQ